MLHQMKIAVVMPAYHAEKTLEDCYRAIPHEIKLSIGVGIGLFITLVGFRDAGITVNDPAPGSPLIPTPLGNTASPQNSLASPSSGANSSKDGGLADLKPFSADSSASSTNSRISSHAPCQSSRA